MFIELTDLLRCPEVHEEAYLVLLPGRMEGREVIEGHLGCPICGRTTVLRDGLVDFGGSTGWTGETGLSPEAVVTLLGITGPGGFVALAGPASRLAPGVAALLPGVALIALNPPPEVLSGSSLSVVRAGRVPLKRASLRGIVLGRDAAERSDWVADAVGALLPGLRAVGEGPTPELAGLELLATGGACWVGRKR